MKKKTLKLFVIRKYIMAEDASHAIKLEKKKQPDDIWIDDEWKKQNLTNAINGIGFTK